MKLDLHTQADVFEQLKSEWNNLLKRSPADNIFSTWEWASIWWAAYHPGQLWVVTCRDDDGRLIGLAPCFLDENRVMRGIGCEDVTDYIDLIIDDDHIETVMGAFASFFEDCYSEFEYIQICNIPEESPTYQKFPEILQQHNFTTEIEQLDVCPLIRLPEVWDDYLSGLDKKQRHEIRRKMRKARAQETEWYTVGPEHDLQAEMTQFLELMAASDPEKKGFLKDDQNVEFFNQFVPVAYEKGWLQINVLVINGQPTAAYLNFDYNKHLLVYNSGQQHGEYDSISPGIVLLAHTIRWAIEEGDYKTFNFLRGDEVYKYRMGGEDTRVYQLTAKINQ